MIYTEAQLIAAHKHSAGNKPELERDKKCGCFYCLRIFDPKEIDYCNFDDNTLDRLGTAFCPYCNIDSVIGESSGFRIDADLLVQMNRYWFGGANGCNTDFKKEN